MNENSSQDGLEIILIIIIYYRLNDNENNEIVEIIQSFEFGSSKSNTLNLNFSLDK